MVNKHEPASGMSWVANEFKSNKIWATSNTRHRAYRLLGLVLVLRPFGNVSLAWGMKHFSQVLSMNPSVYLRAMLNPFVMLGIAMLVLALLTRMALLSLADLSFVVPVTALGYIFSTLLGKVFLSEEVSAARWLGTVLIFLGTALVSSTKEKSGEAQGTVNPALD
jgi:drug/metabolite transporter (DMT)-like permease